MIYAEPVLTRADIVNQTGNSSRLYPRVECIFWELSGALEGAEATDTTQGLCSHPCLPRIAMVTLAGFPIQLTSDPVRYAHFPPGHRETATLSPALSARLSVPWFSDLLSAWTLPWSWTSGFSILWLHRAIWQFACVDRGTLGKI